MLHYNKIILFWLISLIFKGNVIAGEYLFGGSVSAVCCLTHSTKKLIKNIKTYQEHKRLQELALKEKKNSKHDDFNLPFNENSDFNLPFQDISVSNNGCNMPLDIVPAQLKKQACNFQLKKICKSYPNIALSFKTSLLVRLFLNKREIFDVDGYHSMPVSLMQLMLQHGKVSFEEKKKFFQHNNDVKMYRSYGLLYSMGSIKKGGKLIEQFKPIQARLLTKSNKKIDDVIFHIGFERFEKFKKSIKNDKKLIKYCLSIDKLMVAIA